MGLLGVLLWVSFRWLGFGMGLGLGLFHDNENDDENDKRKIKMNWQHEQDETTKIQNRNEAECTRATAKAFRRGNNLIQQFEQVMTEQQQHHIAKNNNSNTAYGSSAYKEHRTDEKDTAVTTKLTTKTTFKESSTTLKETNKITISEEKKSAIISSSSHEKNDKESQLLKEHYESNKNNSSPDNKDDIPSLASEKDDDREEIHIQTDFNPSDAGNNAIAPEIVKSFSFLASSSSSSSSSYQATDQDLSKSDVAQLTFSSVNSFPNTPPSTSSHMPATSTTTRKHFLEYQHQSPEHMAYEFVQNVEIIQQVLKQATATTTTTTTNTTDSSTDSSACSKVNVDHDDTDYATKSRRCALDLAMLHQSSHLKQREHEQQLLLQQQQQSSLLHHKYDQYLKDLAQARDHCFNACSKSIYISIILCILFETSRFVSALVQKDREDDYESDNDGPDYFTVRNAATIVLRMACGICQDDHDNYDNNYYYDDNGNHNSKGVPVRPFLNSNTLSVYYIYYFLSTMMESSYLVQFADYASCIVSYGLVIVMLHLFHGTLRALHCPNFLHQILNCILLISYVAQNPAVWVVMVRNAELYSCWIKVQTLLTITSFIVTMILYVQTRNHLLVRQQQQQQLLHLQSEHNKVITICDAQGRIAQMEDLRWIISFISPTILGLVVLHTTGSFYF